MIVPTKTRKAKLYQNLQNHLELAGQLLKDSQVTLVEKMETSHVITNSTPIPVWALMKDEKLFLAKVSLKANMTTIPATDLDEAGCMGMVISYNYIKLHNLPIVKCDKLQSIFGTALQAYDLIFSIPFQNSIVILYKDWQHKVKCFHTKAGTVH
ncbi:hypothetical protein HK096_004224 [Nowakowskiella sp. JEL0078]|nr:hypothetical protein HK096_004224 [Nowakowskiella sp. JEL0078]